MTIIPYYGIPKIWLSYNPPDTLVKDYKDSHVVVSVLSFVQEIYEGVLNLGFRKEQIFKHTVSQIGAEQYFGLKFSTPVADEIYVDAGCLDGDTIMKFVSFCSGKYVSDNKYYIRHHLPLFSESVLYVIPQ